MKKTLTKIVLLIVAVCMLATSLVACAGSNWDGSKVTLKNWGAEVSQGGFVAETENYIYFINGIGNSTSDNTLGAPVKGALMAADKSDLTKTCIVVPKLFAASDYKAGVYIYGDYVYYGTPSTETSSSGSIANTELVFMRTKLDGTSTESFITVNSLYTEYRIVKGADDVVYIVYYDADKTELVSYNTSTKTAKVIFEKDDKADSESLDVHTFITNDGMDDAVVLFTTTVFNQKYDEESASIAGYDRKAKHNKLYAYKVGEENAKEVLNGEGVDTKTYTVKLVSGGYVFYEEAVLADSNKKVVAIKVSDLYNGNLTTAKVVKNDTYVAEKTLYIKDLENVYVYADSKLIKTGLLANDNSTKEIVSDVASLTQILFEKGDYVYFLADGKLSRAKVNNVDETNEFDVAVQRVSEDTVSTNWFAPQIIGDLVFYADVSDNGQNYVKCINVATATVEKKVEEATTSSDGTITEEKTIYYLTGNKLISIMTDADIVLAVEAKMADITEALNDNSEIELTKVGDDYESAKVKEVRELYNGLTDEQKKLVKEETLQTLKDYEKAIELANVMLKNLPDPVLFQTMTKTQKLAYEDGYNVVKATLSALEKNGDYKYDVILGYVHNNVKYTYQELDKLFNPVED